MEVRSLDPRDVEREVSEPRYRVYFWSQRNTDQRDTDKPGWTSQEWELTAAADVGEALEWAKENASGRSFVMYVVVPADDGQVLVRLQGIDPTAA
jgi:hypothetical protein